jgi:hypothetical protein
MQLLYLPTTTESLADLSIVNFRFSSGNLASFDLRPDNECIHRTSDVRRQATGSDAVSMLNKRRVLLDISGC